MSNFQGHFNAGLIMSSAVVGVAVFTSYIQFNPNIFQLSLHDINLQHIIGIFCTTLFFSLFPDLDTASIPQRWFYRIMLVILTLCYFFDRQDIFSILAFLSIFPMLHKHRGWTHNKSTPWLIALFLAIVFEYFHTRQAWFSEFSLQNVIIFLNTYWIYVLACVTGHYTHLVLDARS